MRIGVISDTHLMSYNKELADIVSRYFSDVDLILHAGDIVDTDVLEIFNHKELFAVCGNMDLESVRKIFPEKLTLEIEGYRIGLVHGWGTPFGIEEKLIKEFEDINCLVYGHTHQATNIVKDNILFFNPGSPTDRSFATRNTIGIIEIEKTISGKIIEV